jgi:DNA-binding MarR family transcriptional regulator
MFNKGKPALILSVCFLLICVQLFMPFVTAYDPDTPPPAQKRMPLDDQVQVLIWQIRDTTPDKSGGYFHPKYIVSTQFKILISNPTNVSYTYHFEDGLIFYLTAVDTKGNIVWRYPSENDKIDKAPVDIYSPSILEKRPDDNYIGSAEWKDQPSGQFYIWPTLVGYNVTRLAASMVVASNCDFFGCTYGVDFASPVGSIPGPIKTLSPPDRTKEKATLGTTVLGAIAAIGFIASTEVGKYSLLGGMVPLYTRLKRKKVLDHFTRGQIHGYILANPGAHMNAIKNMFHVNNGVVAYHLKVLEREGYISSRRDGLKRRFYPGSRSEAQDQKKFLTEVQSLIISHIKKAPGINQSELARLANMSAQVVNYHIKKLIQLGVVVVETEGRATKCFIDARELRRYIKEEERPVSEKDPKNKRSISMT